MFETNVVMSPYRQRGFTPPPGWVRSTAEENPMSQQAVVPSETSSFAEFNRVGMDYTSTEL